VCQHFFINHQFSLATSKQRVDMFLALLSVCASADNFDEAKVVLAYFCEKLASLIPEPRAASTATAYSVLLECFDASLACSHNASSSIRARKKHAMLQRRQGDAFPYNSGLSNCLPVM